MMMMMIVIVMMRMMMGMMMMNPWIFVNRGDERIGKVTFDRGFLSHSPRGLDKWFQLSPAHNDMDVQGEVRLETTLVQTVGKRNKKYGASWVQWAKRNLLEEWALGPLWRHTSTCLIIRSEVCPCPTRINPGFWGRSIVWIGAGLGLRLGLREGWVETSPRS